MKKFISFFAVMFGLVGLSKAGDLIQMNLLDHVMPVTQFQSGQTKLALVDSVVYIGNKNGKSIFDIQAGFNGDTKPDQNEPTGANLIVGGFFKVSTFLNDFARFPDHWKFLSSLEHGPYAFYDFREKKGRFGYQVGLAFSLQPK